MKYQPIMIMIVLFKNVIDKSIGLETNYDMHYMWFMLWNLFLNWNDHDTCIFCFCLFLFLNLKYVFSFSESCVEVKINHIPSNLKKKKKGKNININKENIMVI